MRWIFAALTLFGVWLLMSGVYKPLIIGLGAGSAIFVTWIVWRMERASVGARLDTSQNSLATLGYLVWLIKEIAKSNWAVSVAIMSPSLKVRRHFFTVPFSQKTEMAQAIFANSITLTPGTITVEAEEDYFWVHAVNYTDADNAALAEMDKRVSQTEAH